MLDEEWIFAEEEGEGRRCVGGDAAAACFVCFRGGSHGDDVGR